MVPYAEFGEGWIDVLFVNGFSEEEARSFLSFEAKRQGSERLDGSSLDDETWASIYDVGVLILYVLTVSQHGYGASPTK